MVVGWTLLKWSWNRSHSHLVNCRDHNVISCKSPTWFATIFNSSGFCNISIEIQKIHGDGHQIICALLPFFFRYEILSTTVLFLQLCYSTFLMFFVSQKILNCFMTVWTELCRFFNTCKCYFFFIILALFIQRLTQILGPFVCHLALWFFPRTCVWCHFHECVTIKMEFQCATVWRNICIWWIKCSCFYSQYRMYGLRSDNRCLSFKYTKSIQILFPNKRRHTFISKDY